VGGDGEGSSSEASSDDLLVGMATILVVVAFGVAKAGPLLVSLLLLGPSIGTFYWKECKRVEIVAPTQEKLITINFSGSSLRCRSSAK
jgi:xanthine/uracil permease